MTDTRELVTRLRKGDQMDGETVCCKFDACNCAIMDEAADAIAALSERCRRLTAAPGTKCRGVSHD